MNAVSSILFLSFTRFLLHNSSSNRIPLFVLSSLLFPCQIPIYDRTPRQFLPYINVIYVELETVRVNKTCCYISIQAQRSMQQNFIIIHLNYILHYMCASNSNKNTIPLREQQSKTASTQRHNE